MTLPDPRIDDELPPFTMAVLFGSHFLPYWWLYRSRAYAALAVLTTAVVTLAVVIAGGPLFAEIPLIAAGCYAIACTALGVEVYSMRGVPV